jgi:hypothetical protein
MKWNVKTSSVVPPKKSKTLRELSKGDLLYIKDGRNSILAVECSGPGYDEDGDLFEVPGIDDETSSIPIEDSYNAISSEFGTDLELFISYLDMRRSDLKLRYIDKYGDNNDVQYEGKDTVIPRRWSHEVEY